MAREKVQNGLYEVPKPILEQKIDGTPMDVKIKSHKTVENKVYSGWPQPLNKIETEPLEVNPKLKKTVENTVYTEWPKPFEPVFTGQMEEYQNLMKFTSD